MNESIDYYYVSRNWLVGWLVLYVRTYSNLLRCGVLMGHNDDGHVMVEVREEVNIDYPEP